jgi:uncharacterized damage-inducible protein DinB
MREHSVLTQQERQELIELVRELPSKLTAAVAGLSESELTTQSIEGEWTVAQNIHHIYDAHAVCYIDCRLIVTEENPPLTWYNQDLLAELPDAKSADISGSLELIKQLHVRWTAFWENLPESAWERTAIYPGRGPITLERILQIYSKHGYNHIDQIQRTLAAMK